MADINSLFEHFPDYDVFTCKTEKTDTPPPQWDDTPPAQRQEIPPQRYEIPNRRENANPAPVENLTSDYGDGFGKAQKLVTVKRKTGSNFLSLIYFPALILWLEIVLNLACETPLNPINLLYTVGFSFPIAAVLTLICTFGPNTLNRLLCNVFTFLLTFFYFFQIVYFDIFKSFFTFSSFRSFSTGQFINALSDVKFYLIALIVPYLFNLLLGHRIFGFRRYRISAKITVILLAVVIQIAAISAVNFADSNSREIYRGSSNKAVQERFGLLTMERLDIFRPT